MSYILIVFVLQVEIKRNKHLLFHIAIRSQGLTLIAIIGIQMHIALYWQSNN